VEYATIIGGFGGQGILFAGQVLAQAAVLEGRDVSWMPSYGPEMRGGTASCTVVIADHPIGSPIVDIADGVIALNPPSMAKYERLLTPGGLLIANGSLIEALPGRTDIEFLALPCTGIARTTGPGLLVSVVALGGLIARRPIVTVASVRQALVELVGRHHPELVDADLAAFGAGYDAADPADARASAGVAALA
jgi:2-oxoglutarate ferredoxin oxidoreductase subunit gamma